MEYFIKSIKINKVRHLENIEIPISEIQKKHLILTGKNGSGKTSILEALKYDLVIQLNGLDYKSINPKEILQKFLETKYIYEQSILRCDLENIIEVEKKYNAGEFIIAYFDAKRKNEMLNPEGPKKFELNQKYNIDEKVNKEFLQYLVNLKTQKSFAMTENKDIEIAEKIDKWFEIFENGLKEIFGDKNLKIEFDFMNYNFNIISEGREPFNLNQLSDGYSAVINIITDIILRMENKKGTGYDLEGIVLIDELETHLHIELQKKILPFLTKFFPKIQFIITTHSPFVLNSIENAVIYDLENKTIVEDLSAYSYDGIVENYFEIDKYSSIIKNKVERYESLLLKNELTEDEKMDREELKVYLEIIPFELAPELSAKMSELKMKYGVENV